MNARHHFMVTSASTEAPEPFPEPTPEEIQAQLDALIDGEEVNEWYSHPQGLFSDEPRPSNHFWPISNADLLREALKLNPDAWDALRERLQQFRQATLSARAEKAWAEEHA